MNDEFECCGSCRFKRIAEEYLPTGNAIECHYGPPTVTHDSEGFFYSQWPHVSEFGWCGRYEKGA